ncbi:hypothetical protein N0V93_009889 [Gnomoniopsis smithogilvyi]|uniref:Cyclopropane-fatty-acyl-phospholipid synthase n=1 Tax=Gnomoniopsis smithogilvyi TaxID=1191159 RepID=A0A9W8YJ06_9PEZI|nr:hypothetical protein N0V93_009889 [Gnomoniopsis smithogilvyi]
MSLQSLPRLLRAKVKKLLGVVFLHLLLLSRRLVLGSLSGSTTWGSLVIKTPDGTTTTIGRKSPKATVPVIQVHNEMFWLRVLLFGDMGFAQSYMLREFSTADLTAIFEFFVQNGKSLNKSTTSGLFTCVLGRLMDLVPRWIPSPWKAINNISTARLNATAHYSLSNDMFEAFLSPDMTYSAPIWLPRSDPCSKTESLQDAQQRKLQYAISATRIGKNDHVLEIGTGWGSFAIQAVQTTGCRVTTVTPSGEQKRLAEARIKALGLENHISVVQRDYRELDHYERFDKIVSIEMIEHVGHEFLDTYFRCVDRYLKKDGGIAYFQCITIPETRYATYRRGEDFIKKYVFPGGHLPTVSGLVGSIDRGSQGRLIVEEVKNVGMHYSRALRCWNEKFQASFKSDIIPALQKSHPKMTKADIESFRRKWEYYFCYSENIVSPGRTVRRRLIFFAHMSDQEYIDKNNNQTAKVNTLRTEQGAKMSSSPGPRHGLRRAMPPGLVLPERSSLLFTEERDYQLMLALNGCGDCANLLYGVTEADGPRVQWCLFRLLMTAKAVYADVPYNDLLEAIDSFSSRVGRELEEEVDVYLRDFEQDVRLIEVANEVARMRDEDEERRALEDLKAYTTLMDDQQLEDQQQEREPPEGVEEEDKHMN